MGRNWTGRKHRCMEKKTITIITPWLNSPELIPTYIASVKGADVIIIDNGSDELTRRKLADIDATVIRNETNIGYSKANNQGLKQAKDGIVVFLNNDIEARGDWLEIVADFQPGALYGTQAETRIVDGIPVRFLAGWCLCGHKSDFDRIGGWSEIWEGMYWEDNELCWRAEMAGLELKQVNLPLLHYSNYTTSRTPGAYDKRPSNQALFERIVRQDKNNG